MAIQLTSDIVLAAPDETVDEWALFVIRMVPDLGVSYAPWSEATTAMVRAMLAFDFTGKRVLDFGCASGILSLLAAKLGAAEVVAYDYIPDLAELAQANIEANGLDNASAVSADPGDSYDVILANVGDADVVVPLVARSGYLFATARAKRQRLSGGRGIPPTYTRAASDIAMMLRAKGRTPVTTAIDSAESWSLVEG